MLFTKFFNDLGFSEKESLIFLNLYKLWTQPASIIAKYSNLERTYVYKVLLKLCDENLVSVTTKNNIKYFFISDLSLIKKYIKQKKDSYKKLENDYQNIEAELIQFNKKFNFDIPKITLYDSLEWLKNIYDDISDYILKKWYLSIKLFASNTLDSSWSSNDIVKKYREDFFWKLKESHIFVDTFLWNWISLMESLWRVKWIDWLNNLPAANSSINIIIVWNIVYIIIFKDVPIWIRIDSEELAYSMHFIFEHLN